ncbi:MAG: hypothetical protein OXU32_06905 [Gammaproteobacteria bacterium]|nr:hypothetical protein [Gammaproteobacteria bacterium]
MNRLKILATATLVALAFTACDEGTPPPVEPPPPPTPVGTISGSVTIEGTAAAGITATLSSGATQTTGAGGNFAFAGVEAGTYTVTISGFPEDATFAQVTQSATIASDGQNVQLNFAGEYIRSSAVVGSVVAADAMMSGGDGQPETLAGVTVTLGGEHAMGEIMETGMDGGFAFTGLRAGTYTVTISDFPEDVSFETVSVEVEVDVGEVGQADFTGHYIRTSAVEGQVVIEGEGLQGVLVTLAGGPADENFTMMTDVDGMYRFEDLRPGDYTVSISDFDTRDYEFAATSQDVSVDLDETGTVSFTGVLLRTSGISGRVSVEGMGLGDIAVTLSGAADASTTTDAGGQYAFAGLAAGDYTVSIAVDDPAYVFDSMSMDRTVGDDESAIVNFEGAHARTASVSGHLFLDELDKNDMMDAGEHPLAHAGIPVALVGPGVNDQRLSATGADGSFMFSGLRAGSYQLVVPIDATVAATLAANDVAYGGPGTGYAFALGVGEAMSQAIPFDITHTTVNFSVSLRSGDDMGDALPGASVTLYGASDANVGSGMTGDDGSVAIKVARAMTSGNMVMAGVSAEGYDVADGMTEVTWDPQMFATSGANDNDIVNLNVDVSVSGATVMTDFGGGEALAGWAISVMMGDAAVEGAPTMLGADGSAAFATTVASVPASFTFSVAEDQDDDLDGGEMYEGVDGAYMHTGLKVAGATAEADPIVVSYTTQTLKVYVHHERDQVMGYTGNVLGGDQRVSEELVDLEIRQVSGNDGRLTRPISRDDWDARENTSHATGEYTFAHLPADMDIVVRANARDGYKLLDLDRLDTYRNMEENGVMGGAFGDMGGWGHTVTLCPLTEVEPTGQDFGKCSSFAVVTTHNVTANVSKRGVAKSGTGFNTTAASLKRASGITVSLTPIEGKNLAGDGRSFTTARSNDPTTAIDERTDHDFGTMAAGSYELGLPDGWMGMAADMRAAVALNPLASDLDIKVTPSTATVYGFVRSTDGFGLENVTVTVNGESATTDDLGRYIVPGITAMRGQLFVNTARAGFPATWADSTNNPRYHDAANPHDNPVPGFTANTVTRYDFTLHGANNTVTISGVVTESGTGAGIKGVQIRVDGAAPLNASGSPRRLLTGDDGSYMAVVEAQPFDDPLVNVSASRSGWHFLPTSFPVPAIAGSSGTANFEGRRAAEITGMVTAPGGGPMRDVTVTAWADAAMTDSVYAFTTSETGTFSVFVPTLSGTVYLDAKPRSNYGPSSPSFLRLRDAERYVWFDAPDTRPGGAIAVIPGQPLSFGTFTGNSVQPRITRVQRVAIADYYEGEVTASAIVPNAATRGFTLLGGEPTDTVRVTWQYETRNATGAYSAAVGATVELTTGTGTSLAAPTGTPNTPDADARPATATDGTSVTHTRTTTYILSDAGDAPDYGDINVRIGNTVVGADGTAAAAIANSAPRALAGVNVDVRSLAVTRSGTSITATWRGEGSPRLEQRIALRVSVNGAPRWVIFEGTSPAVAEPAEARATNTATDTGANWGRWSWTFDLSTGAADWPDAGGGATYTLTATDLQGADMLRVDTRTDPAGTWKTDHGSATIP